jgi:ribose transport system substrate-binding protein
MRPKLLNLRFLFIVALTFSLILGSCQTSPKTITEEAKATQPVVTTNAPLPTTAPVVATEALQPKWKPGQIATADYKPVIRKAKQEYLIGYGEGLASWELCASFRKGMQRVADQMGVKLVLCDDNYPDTEAPLNCARTFVSQKVNGVMSSLWVEDLTPAVMDIWNAANIPVVSLDVVHPGAPFFGQDNCKVGTMAAEYAIKEYVPKYLSSVPQNEMYVVTIENPAVGETPLQRPRCFANAFKKLLPDIPEKNYFVLPSDGSNEKVFEAMSTWLTGHPEAKHAFSTAINTMESTGAATAFEVANRKGDGVIVGMEGTEASMAEICKPNENTAYKGDVLFYPENYADYMLPMIVDMIEGNPVPEFVYMDNKVANHDNIRELLPGVCK